jgi:hypothetical protein
MKSRHSKQNLNRAEFLEELRKECALHFDPEVTDTLVMEVDAHITESIQARLELGDIQEDAELNAVRSFHQPKKFVSRMGQVHHDMAGHDRPLFLIGLAFVCWLAFYVEDPKHVGWIVGLLGALLLFASIVIRSAQIGSMRRGTLCRLAVAAFLVIGIISPLRTVNLWAYGGMGFMPVSMARDLVSDTDSFVRSQTDGSHWAANYVNNFQEMAQQDVEPAKHALDATLLSRYAANLPQTMPNLAVSFGLIVLAHLLPVVIRRRWRKFLAAQRRTLA